MTTSLMTTTNITELPEVLPPEIEEGNVEYKSRLVAPTESRLEHLITQMKYRLQEGNGEALYEMGVEDKGRLAGLKEDEMQASLNTLHNMAARLGASLMVLREKRLEGEGGRRVVEVLVTKLHHEVATPDVRLAVLGSVDSGKSTLLGVLTQGELDNGRGRARLNVLRHVHEVQTGRTSSICHEVMGFDKEGGVLNYSSSIEDIVDTSVKLVSFLDLCGHHKYLKTTLFGLTGYAPDHAMLLVSASTGIVGTTKEHLGYALALDISAFVVINKTDMSRQSQLSATVAQLGRLIRGPGCGKTPVLMSSKEQVVSEMADFAKGRTCPMVAVSCVSGENLDVLCCLLRHLPSSHHHRNSHPPEFQIDQVWSESGVVMVGGSLLRGSISQGDNLLLGPSIHSAFKSVKVASIQRNKLPCGSVVAGQTACLNIGDFGEFVVRKGQVVVGGDNSTPPRGCFQFEADVVLLYHNKTLCRGFQAVVHAANVRQVARIVHMNKSGMRTNDKGLVTFRFNNRPEYLRAGVKLLFREGRTKGMGRVTKVL